MTRKTLLIIVLLACIAAGGLAVVPFVMSRPYQQDVSRLLINVPVPPFIRPEFSNDDLKGHISIVNFFASWCPPCEIEHPQLLRMKKDFGLSIYGINYKDSDSSRRDYLERLGNPYTAITMDANGTLSQLWDTSGVPETIIIDAEGNIRYRINAPLSQELVDRIIIPLVRAIQVEQNAKG